MMASTSAFSMSSIAFETKSSSVCTGLSQNETAPKVVAPSSFARMQTRCDVVDVVEPVEGADDSEPVGIQPLHPGHDDIVGQEVEERDVLRPDQRPERGVRRVLMGETHTLPWIFLEIAHRDIELDRSDEIDLIEADLVEIRTPSRRCARFACASPTGSDARRAGSCR